MTFDEAAIERVLPRIDVRAALETMFHALAEGRATQPPQTLSLFSDDAGDFITCPAVLADEKVLGAKLSPYISGDGKALVSGRQDIAAAALLTVACD